MRFDLLPYPKENFPPRSPDTLEGLLVTLFKPHVVHRHRSGFQHRLWNGDLGRVSKYKVVSKSTARRKMKRDIASASTNAIRDAVPMERAGCRHHPWGQCGMIGEGGEEGLQLEVGAKRVCGPLCGDVPKETLLCMPKMVARRHLVSSRVLAGGGLLKGSFFSISGGGLLGWHVSISSPSTAPVMITVLVHVFTRSLARQVPASPTAAVCRGHVSCPSISPSGRWFGPSSGPLPFFLP